MRRTPTVELDKDFEFVGNITKAFVDSKTGERHIVGVASGVKKDRDGERVSKNAIQEMAREVGGGMIALTSSHQQDWMTEIGKAVGATHDPQTDELIIDTVLPAEGTDAIADKGWRVANQERVGFSIGGKLVKSYFERDELGKKTKVLDSIQLRHFCLTKSPAYQDSFAHAVAKTWDGETPADEEFTLDPEVEKDATGSWAGGSSESGGGNVGRDSVGSGPRNAGQKDDSKASMDTEDGEKDDDDNENLPKAKQERHLACPNCGHEFAADLPVDPDERQVDETNDNNEDDDQSKKDTGKSAERNMSTPLSETLDTLKALADADAVEKTEEKAPEPEPVEKADTEVLEVAKMVAASHKAHEDRFAELEGNIGAGFELIAKSHKAMKDLIESMPQGRKSTARVLPPPSGHDEDGEQPIAKQVAEAPDALTALKIQNKALYGVE